MRLLLLHPHPQHLTGRARARCSAAPASSIGVGLGILVTCAGGQPTGWPTSKRAWRCPQHTQPREPKPTRRAPGGVATVSTPRVDEGPASKPSPLASTRVGPLSQQRPSPSGHRGARFGDLDVVEVRWPAATVRAGPAADAERTAAGARRAAGWPWCCRSTPGTTELHPRWASACPPCQTPPPRPLTPPPRQLLLPAGGTGPGRLHRLDASRPASCKNQLRGAAPPASDDAACRRSPSDLGRRPRIRYRPTRDPSSPIAERPRSVRRHFTDLVSGLIDRRHPRVSASGPSGCDGPSVGLRRRHRFERVGRRHRRHGDIDRHETPTGTPERRELGR